MSGHCYPLVVEACARATRHGWSIVGAWRYPRASVEIIARRS